MYNIYEYKYGRIRQNSKQEVSSTSSIIKMSCIWSLLRKGKKSTGHSSNYDKFIIISIVIII